MSETCRLYLITPERIGPDYADALSAALDAGDVASLQLRLKGVDDDTIRRAIETLMPISQSHEVAFILNDRPDLAREMGCDGVHVGQEDAPYAEARRIMGPQAIVGVTCKASRDLAMEAAEAGADYVAFGGFFRSTTKNVGGITTPTDPELLTWWQEMFTVPCVAIGGITVENCPVLVRAGADFLSVSAGIWAYPQGPAAAVRDFNAKIAEVLREAAQ